jgi:hypothetical protein
MPVGTDAIQRSVSQCIAREGLSAMSGADGSGDASEERDASASESGARGRCASPPWRGDLRAAVVRWWAAPGRPAGIRSRRVFHAVTRSALPRPADSGGSGGEHGEGVVGVSSPTRGGRYFIYRPLLGSQEPSDRQQAV